jgi:hypothetical protein
VATELGEQSQPVDDAETVERARVRWRRRRRLRRSGLAFYALALVLVVAGAINVMRNRHHQPAAALRAIPTVPLTVPVASTTAPTAPPADAPNTPPVINAPDSIRIARTGRSAIPGISITDAEASRNTSAVGVIVYAPDGNLYFDRQYGVRIYQPNGTPWIPITGRLTDVNDALSSLAYEPRTAGARPLQVLVSDFGGGNAAKALAARRTVPLTVAP